MISGYTHAIIGEPMKAQLFGFLVVIVIIIILATNCQGPVP